jgi:hypothetical protein
MLQQIEGIRYGIASVNAQIQCTTHLSIHEGTSLF